MDFIGYAIPIAGAALAIFLAGFGSSIGISTAGQAADGVLTEDPDKFTSLLILVVLPGTQGIYGLLGGFLIMFKLGLLGGPPVSLNLIQSWQIFFAALPVGFAGWISGAHQGKVCAAGVAMAARRPETLMKGVIYGAMVETYAIFGLITTILLLWSIKV
ncbi:MAG: V-type ATP synthase subunit K [Promethearchaeota archaeon]